MSLKRAFYKDEYGRLKAVLIPDTEIEENAEKGVPLGPPDLSELGWPLELEVRLNNELYHRGILSPTDALKRRTEVTAALQAALKLDTESVIIAYLGKDYKNARREEPTKEQPNKTVPYRRSRKPTKRA